MKRLLLAALVAHFPVPGIAAHETAALAANGNWLTIMGDPQDASSVSIQIDPRPVSVVRNTRLMNIRLNRKTSRTSTDGVTFRSYFSEVEFDCARQTARFTRTHFFAGPLWTDFTRTLEFSRSTPRPMEFREIKPNPKMRVIRAACAKAPAVIQP